MSEQEVKPCKCGATDEPDTFAFIHLSPDEPIAVTCLACGAVGPSRGTMYQAVKAWNERRHDAEHTA